MAEVPPPREAETSSKGRATAVLRQMRTMGSSLDVWLQNASYRIVHHFLWKSLIVVFTIVLLLGRPLNLWFIDAVGNRTLNVLHLLGFAIFVVDLIFHCYLDPMYYPSIDFTCQHQRNTNSSSRRRCCPCVFHMGSFNFWFDVLSTICFLLEVDFIYPARFEQSTILIPLNNLGFPDPGVFGAAVQTKNSLFSRTSVVILIFKTTRVARLVPPKTVVDLSTKINLHWYLVRLNPTFYWKRSQRRSRLSREVKRNNNFMASRGSLFVAAEATFAAMEEKERKMKERGKLVYAAYMLKKWAETTLRCLRILPDTNIEFNRQIAATRIQRAWRNRNSIHAELRSDDGEGSQAWMSSDNLTPSSQDFIEVFGRRSRASKNSRASRNSNQRGSKSDAPIDQNNAIRPRESIRRSMRKKAPSQVGTAMAQVTGQSVAVFLFVNLLLVLGLTYIEHDTTDASTMVILHGQTTRGNIMFAEKAVDTARRTTIPHLHSYTVTSSNEDNHSILNLTYESVHDLRKHEIRNITVMDTFGRQTTGLFSIKDSVDQRAVMEVFLLVFVLLTWFFGVAAFAGPIMTLVIIPIERAVKLLSMLVMDPLGYRNTLRYKNFLTEADQIAKNNGRWTREILKGMETEFLMSTIVRIGSLMKVGFGSAGVQIIRNNLQKSHGTDTDTLLLNSQGSMVSCIFLFCDIRSFTDATECLQEEVFVFTNQIAGVVHSFCSSYGGSANKNIGDAFLISWKLDDTSSQSRRSFNGIATRNQADKALYSVVKICMALYHNDHYVGMLSDHAKETLLKKLKDRPGPTVQLGFGLHAGSAVEGAIGSQRKIDATYVSMAVEKAEYLESSTKKYKVPMLMSDSFHRLLNVRRRRRCRKIDRVMFENESDELCEQDDYSRGKLMELFTYDIDIDALWDDSDNKDDSDGSESDSGELLRDSSLLPRRRADSGMLSRGNRDDSLFSSIRSRGSITESFRSQGGDIAAAIAAVAAKVRNPMMLGESSHGEEEENQWKDEKPELVLPTGPALYSENIWLQSDIRRIRKRYTTNIFDMFNTGLQKYYSKEWDEAKRHFEDILDCFEDGPSRYFLNEMQKHEGIPPEGFRPYSIS